MTDYSTLANKTDGYHWINKGYVATYNNELVSAIHYNGNVDVDDEPYTLLIATNHEDNDDTYTSNTLDGFDGKLDVFKLTDPYGESDTLEFAEVTNKTTQVAFTYEVRVEEFDPNYEHGKHYVYNSVTNTFDEIG